MERPSATFCNKNYSFFEDFCSAKFYTYYALENKSSKTGEYQRDDLDNNLIESNHEKCSYPLKIKLMILGEKMLFRKVRQIF